MRSERPGCVRGGKGRQVCSDLSRPLKGDWRVTDGRNQSRSKGPRKATCYESPRLICLGLFCKFLIMYREKKRDCASSIYTQRSERFIICCKRCVICAETSVRINLVIIDIIIYGRTQLLLSSRNFCPFYEAGSTKTKPRL